MHVIQFAPRTGSVETDTPDVLVPALARLQRCKDRIDIYRICEELPDQVLPHLAWAASRRQTTPSFAVRTLMKCCGDLFLERSLGSHRLRQLKTRYPATEVLSGL